MNFLREVSALCSMFPSPQWEQRFEKPVYMGMGPRSGKPYAHTWHIISLHSIGTLLQKAPQMAKMMSGIHEVLLLKLVGVTLHTNNCTAQLEWWFTVYYAILQDDWSLRKPDLNILYPLKSHVWNCTVGSCCV